MALVTLSLLLLTITKTSPVEAIVVSGKSMESTLHDRDKGVLFTTSKINQYDIIVFEKCIDGKDTLLIKRVIGLPGDSVKCIGKTVYVNGNPIVEFAKDPNCNTDFSEQIVPANCYFVLGDNRKVSLDSRYEEVGFVSADCIKGVFYSAK